MLFNNINTNLASKCYNNLENGLWEIGLFSDNPDLSNKNSDYFEDFTSEGEDEKVRILRNKVKVLLLNGKTKYAHIIHWHPSNGYFCITNSNFWDKFDN